MGDTIDQGARRGLAIRPLDSLLGDDILDDTQYAGLVHDAATMVYPVWQSGSPCRSFSQARRRRVRSKGLPWGLLSGLAQRERAFLDRENAITERALFLLLLARAAGSEIIAEHPAKTNDKAFPRFFDVRASLCASLWDLDEAITFCTIFHCLYVEFAQCALHGDFRKATRLLYSPFLHAIFGPLGSLDCEHAPGQHPGGQAHGRDRHGRSLSAHSAAYPFAMCTLIVDAVALRAGRSVISLRSVPRTVHHPTPSHLACFDCVGDDDTPPLVGDSEDDTLAYISDTSMPDLVDLSDSGDDDEAPPSRRACRRDFTPIGGAAGGPYMAPLVQRAVEEARSSPPPFASSRHALPASDQELLSRAMRDDTRASSDMRARHSRHSLRSPGQPFGHPPPSTSGLPSRRIRLPDLFLPGVWERLLTWLAAADLAMAALERGEFMSPGTLVILQEDLQPWARAILWDTSDPENCVFAQPSSRDLLHSERGKARQIDPTVLRRMAAELGWDDLDICDQAEDGIESRTRCSLSTVLSFHHTGLSRNLQVARTVIAKDIAEGWVRKASRLLPRLPARCLPRNIVLADKTTVDPVTQVMTHTQKPRISTDESDSKSKDAPNAGIPQDEKSLELCRAQHLAESLAIIAPACGGISRVGASVIDLESAFRFLLYQWLDLWLHLFLWWDEDGTVGFCIDLRVTFGGATGPNRFQRVTLILRAYVMSRIAAFDLAHPLPPLALDWSAARLRVQQDGRLADGECQLAPRFSQVFLDDLALAGGVDTVPVPDYLHDIHLSSSREGGEIEPITGGVAIPRSARIHVYTLIAMWCIRLLRLAWSAPKISCGTRVICLGFRVAPDLGVIDVPEVKAIIMLATMRELRASVAAHTPLPIDTLERLVGRLCNISQIYAAIRLWLSAGYALVRIRYAARRQGHRGGGRHRVQQVLLRAGGRRERDLLRLFDVAEKELHSNSGIPLAARSVFPGYGESGVAVVVTDASGVDGVGGYAFISDFPEHVWLFSEWWPAPIQTALDQVALRAAERQTGSHRFAMPSAEAFGQYAVARALSLCTPVHAVIAVGDCMPVTRAITSASSASAQIRSLLAAMQCVARQWLAVHIHRELNVDPDRLSHPAQYDDVERDVMAAGWITHRLRLDGDGWHELTRACSLPLAVDELDPAFT